MQPTSTIRHLSKQSGYSAALCPFPPSAQTFGLLLKKRPVPKNCSIFQGWIGTLEKLILSVLTSWMWMYAAEFSLQYIQTGGKKLYLCGKICKHQHSIRSLQNSWIKAFSSNSLLLKHEIWIIWASFCSLSVAGPLGTIAKLLSSFNLCAYGAMANQSRKISKILVHHCKRLSVLQVHGKIVEMKSGLYPCVDTACAALNQCSTIFRES